MRGREGGRGQEQEVFKGMESGWEQGTGNRAGKERKMGRGPESVAGTVDTLNAPPPTCTPSAPHAIYIYIYVMQGRERKGRGGTHLFIYSFHNPITPINPLFFFSS